MKYFKKLTGEKIYLSPINPDDFEKYTEWINDLDVTINLTLSSSIISAWQEKELLENLSSDNNNFAIVDKDKDRLIGNCGLLNVDSINRKADMGIFIGDKNYWNKGFGTEAIQLLLDFGFNVRNLNSIMLTVYEFNKRAIKCYEKCGFKKMGVRREACIYGNRKYGEVYMDILAHEFESKYINKILDSKLD